jgi:hypothetical protein
MHFSYEIHLTWGYNINQCEKSERGGNYFKESVHRVQR